MMLATTSIADVIAIMVVAVTLFFASVGVIALFKLLLRLIRGGHVQRIAKRPSPRPVGRAIQELRLPGWIIIKLVHLTVAAVIIGLLMILKGLQFVWNWPKSRAFHDSSQ